jgi:hypothetical protein
LTFFTAYFLAAFCYYYFTISADCSESEDSSVVSFFTIGFFEDFLVVSFLFAFGLVSSEELSLDEELLSTTAFLLLFLDFFTYCFEDFYCDLIFLLLCSS